MTKAATFETEVSNLKKQVAKAVKAATSAANSAANTADKGRKQSDALIKRVTKLESK